ncbi:MAG: oligosaccharide flippase family protein [Saprospiraceae bacterium]|nr:oligosaccharide flippase family protein [Saprospiraceae bacterium]
MNREFLLNIAFLIGINLLIKPLYIFGIDRGVQNALPPGDYGYYFVLFNFTWLFQIVNDFGIAYYNSRNLAQHPQLISKYFPNLLMLKAALTLLFAVFIFIASAAWGYAPWSNALLWFICLNQALTSLVLFLRSNISGLGMYRIDSGLSALDRLLVILIMGAVLWVLPIKLRIEHFVWSQTAALSLTGLVAFGVLRGRLGQWQFRWRPAFLRVFFRRSFPYALAVFLMTLYTRVDAVMIERMLPDGKEEAGIYAAAYRLLDAANIIGFLFAGLLLPMFARLLKAGSGADALAHLSFRILWAMAIPLALFCWYWGEEIMRLLYHRADAYYGEVLGVLMLSFVAMCGMYVYGTLLTANESLRRMNLIFAAGLALNIALNWALIPTHKALGAAAATSATQLVVWLAEMLLLRKELRILPPPSLLLRLAGFVLIAGAVAFGASHFWSGHWLGAMTLAAVVIAVAALLLRLVSMREMRGLMKR